MDETADRSVVFESQKGNLYMFRPLNIRSSYTDGAQQHLDPGGSQAHIWQSSRGTEVVIMIGIPTFGDRADYSFLRKHKQERKHSSRSII